jgi:hypothetical protein
MKSNKFKQIYGLFFKRSVALWIFIFLLMGVLGIKVFHIVFYTRSMDYIVPGVGEQGLQ